MTEILSDLIARHPADAPAIGAPERPWLDFGGLRALAAATTATLHAAGIGRGDRVAIVLPNGPEMAAAFVTVAQAAVIGPREAARDGPQVLVLRDDPVVIGVDGLAAGGELGEALLDEDLGAARSRDARRDLSPPPAGRTGLPLAGGLHADGLILQDPDAVAALDLARLGLLPVGAVRRSRDVADDPEQRVERVGDAAIEDRDADRDRLAFANDLGRDGCLTRSRIPGAVLAREKAAVAAHRDGPEADPAAVGGTNVRGRRTRQPGRGRDQQRGHERHEPASTVEPSAHRGVIDRQAIPPGLTVIRSTPSWTVTTVMNSIQDVAGTIGVRSFPGQSISRPGEEQGLRGRRRRSHMAGRRRRRTVP